ncbi:DUF481 domain-containing protein [Dyadobacter arcticus]|uniref:DUF481 domain-containing protein n=1 Tax=Dyadobacter arcticus TaxID=1078754 RepID=A0ABX0UKN1_9BACT|nr:DUF481 domain-containing protein [Dyadobacter arcticus]NIJ52634.1 hypothetical protein [Dyadobacter arcticus]
MISIVLLSLSATKTSAQLNRKDTLAWQSKLSATGSFLDGNVARLSLVNRLEVAYADELWGMSSRNDYQYGTTKHVKTEDDFISYNFGYFKPQKKIYPYLMGIAETNYRRKIKLRYQLGPGISYTIPSKKGILARLSATGTYEYTRFGGTKFENLSDTLSKIITTARITGRLFGMQRIFENKMRLSYEFWWQQSVEDDRNFRIYNEEILEIPFNKNVSFRTGFRYSYENIRIRGLKPYDLFWTFGLTIGNF